eukprot:g3156.t1
MASDIDLIEWMLKQSNGDVMHIDESLFTEQLEEEVYNFASYLETRTGQHHHFFFLLEVVQLEEIYNREIDIVPHDRKVAFSPSLRKSIVIFQKYFCNESYCSLVSATREFCKDVSEDSPSPELLVHLEKEAKKLVSYFTIDHTCITQEVILIVYSLAKSCKDIIQKGNRDVVRSAKSFLEKVDLLRNEAKRQKKGDSSMKALSIVLSSILYEHIGPYASFPCVTDKRGIENLYRKISLTMDGRPSNFHWQIFLPVARLIRKHLCSKALLGSYLQSKDGLSLKRFFYKHSLEVRKLTREKKMHTDISNINTHRPNGIPSESWERFIRHVKILYLIAQYGKSSEFDDEEETWIRAIHLHTLVFEAIQHGALDLDYAPKTKHISPKGRTELYISQEACQVIVDFEKRGLIRHLKALADDFTRQDFYQVAPKGQDMLDSCHPSIFYAIHDVLTNGDIAHTHTMLEVKFDSKLGTFNILHNGVRVRTSQVTQIEDVDLQLIPYFPVPILASSFRTGSFKKFSKAFGKMDHHQDAVKLFRDENSFLVDPRLLLVEWLPMGRNELYGLGMRIDVLGRSKHNMFANVPDRGSNECTPSNYKLTSKSKRGIPKAQVMIDVVDYKKGEYINTHVRNVSKSSTSKGQADMAVHFNTEGSIVSCCQILHHQSFNETTRSHDISLDKLSRSFVKIRDYATNVTSVVFSVKQNEMIKALYGRDERYRDTYAVYIGNSFKPDLSSDAIFKSEPILAELQQVIGEIINVFDVFHEQELKCFVGTEGMIVTGKHVKSYERLYILFARLKAQDLYLSRLYKRLLYNFSLLSKCRDMIIDRVKNPTFLMQARTLIDNVRRNSILLLNALDYAEEAIAPNSMTSRLVDEIYNKLQSTSGLHAKTPYLISESGALCQISRDLVSYLDIYGEYQTLQRRVKDMKKVLQSLELESFLVKNLLQTATTSTLHGTVGEIAFNTSALCSAANNEKRGQESIAIMESVMASSLVFALFDRIWPGTLNVEYTGTDYPHWMQFIETNIVHVPGLWPALNLIGVLIFVISIKYISQRLRDKQLGVVTHRLQIFQRFRRKTFHDFFTTMEEKKLGTIDTTDFTDNRAKYTWTPSSTADHPWIGYRPKIILHVDNESQFFLHVNLQIFDPNQRLDKNTIQLSLMEYLKPYLIPPQSKKESENPTKPIDYKAKGSFRSLDPKTKEAASTVNPIQQKNIVDLKNAVRNPRVVIRPATIKQRKRKYKNPTAQ